MEKINKKSVFNLVIRVLFMLSSPFFTILLSNRYDYKVVLVGAIISFLISIFVDYKYLRNIQFDKKCFFISIFISLYSLKYYLRFENSFVRMLNNLVKHYFGIVFDDFIYKIIVLLSVPFFSVLIYLFIKKILPIIKQFYCKLSKSERKYLIIISFIGLFVSIVLPFLTTAFSIPMHNNKLYIYDVIYTSDSGAITYEDAFFNVSYVENDVRQPLFGIFSLPFSIVGKLLAEILFFVPEKYEYVSAMTFIQFVLLSLSTILISRMLKLKEKDKKYLYLLFSISFSYMIFGIILEQYVIGLFYLVLTCYYFYEKKLKPNYLYVGAVGTMLTSGIVFPLISEIKNLKRYITDTFKCFLVFLSVLTIGGQFPQMFSVLTNFSSLISTFAKKISFVDRFYQFINFIKGIIIAPKGKVMEILNHPSYQLAEVKSIALLGVIVLIAVILGYILNRKNKFANFCILWVAFSVMLLLFIGWGTSENGLILYSLYFAFAYLSLFYLFLRSIIKNDKVFRFFVILLCLTILLCNIPELVKILSFAIKNY